MSIRVFVADLAVIAALVAGCAGPTAQLDSENARLRKENSDLKSQGRKDRHTIRNLRNEIVLLRDKAVRPQPLPVEVRAPSTPAPAAAAESGDDVAMVDPDVYMEDGGVEVVYIGEAAMDDTQRPSIELTERLRSDEYRAVDDDPPAKPTTPAIDVPVESTTPPPPPAPSPTGDHKLGVTADVPPLSAAYRRAQAAKQPAATDPRDDYQKYYRALRAGNHAYAIAGFREFVAHHPTHDYADNAQYWLGEAYYDQKQFREALVEFRTVVVKFPKGNKAPDALLKIAYCHERLGDLESARATLRDVIAKFPNTSPAALAERRLAKLSDEGSDT